MELYAEREQNSRWRNPRARAIRANMYAKQIPFAGALQTISRKNSYIRLFYEFAQDMCAAENRPFDKLACLGDDELVEMWISDIVEEDCGATRPGAARTAMNTKRKALFMAPLPKRANVTTLVNAAKNKAPKNVKKSAKFSKARIRQVVDYYKSSAVWYLVMFALATALGFLCVLRLGEVVQLYLRGIKLVRYDGSEVSVKIVSIRGMVLWPVLPPVSDVLAVRLYLPFRKTIRANGSWILISDPRVRNMFVRHLLNLRHLRYEGKFLFPSKMRVAKRFQPPCPWMPNPDNPMSNKTYIDTMREALRVVCRFPVDVCKLYTGHALRVSGSNFIRRDKKLGDDLGRQVGGWMHLASQDEYQQMSLVEHLHVVRPLNLN